MSLYMTKVCVHQEQSVARTNLNEAAAIVGPTSRNNKWGSDVSSCSLQPATLGIKNDQ